MPPSVPDTRRLSSCPSEAGGALTPDFCLLHLSRSDRPIERSAQLLGAFERELNTGASPRVEPGVYKVERDDVG
jgi:hypothetical protein